jgi:hypothetical protein
MPAAAMRSAGDAAASVPCNDVGSAPVNHGAAVVVTSARPPDAEPGAT